MAYSHSAPMPVEDWESLIRNLEKLSQQELIKLLLATTLNADGLPQVLAEVVGRMLKEKAA